MKFVIGLVIRWWNTNWVSIDISNKFIIAPESRSWETITKSFSWLKGILFQTITLSDFCHLRKEIEIENSLKKSLKILRRSAHWTLRVIVSRTWEIGFTRTPSIGPGGRFDWDKLTLNLRRSNSFQRFFFVNFFLQNFPNILDQITCFKRGRFKNSIKPNSEVLEHSSARYSDSIWIPSILEISHILDTMMTIQNLVCYSDDHLKSYRSPPNLSGIQILILETI